MLMHRAKVICSLAALVVADTQQADTTLSCDASDSSCHPKSSKGLLQFDTKKKEFSTEQLLSSEKATTTKTSIYTDYGNTITTCEEVGQAEVPKIKCVEAVKALYPDDTLWNGNNLANTFHDDYACASQWGCMYFASQFKVYFNECNRSKACCASKANINFHKICQAVVVPAEEVVVSVDLCPDYNPSPHCGNELQMAGVSVGDKCSIPCETWGAARWCPTTDDHSGDAGTAWGWCAKPEGQADCVGFNNCEGEATCAVGDAVTANWNLEGGYYGAVIASLDSDGTITVDWNDGDTSSRTLAADQVKKDGLSCSSS